MRVLSSLLCSYLFSVFYVVWLPVEVHAETASGSEVPESGVVWQRTFERSLRFHNLVDTDLLLAGTARHLYAIDPGTGDRRWRERNVNPSQQDIYRIPGSGTILVADASGGAFDDADTHVLAINADDGRMIWESPRLAGKAMQGVVDENAQALYVTAIGEAHGDDRGILASPISGKGLGAGTYRVPRLLSMELDTGAILWQTSFDRKVRLRPDLDEPAGRERPFDLGGYHRPLVVGRMLCVTYYGVRCLNRFTGATVWDQEFPVVEDDLALAYAPPVVVGDTIYATGNNRIHAFDLDTGKRRWRSKKAKVFPEIQVDDDALYAQLGGRFFHLGNERQVWKGEFGVMVVNRADGRTRWRFDDAKSAISNLHFEADRIWFADAGRLYALDRRTGTRMLRTKHRMAEPPTFLVLNRHGHLVLVSDDEVAAFDRKGKRLWYVHHPAPRPGIWQRVSSQLFQVSGNLLRVASMAVSAAGGLLPAMPSVAGVTVISSKSVARRATRSAGNQLMEAGENLADQSDYEALENSFQYFLTASPGMSKESGQVYLATVDINTGQTVSLTPLPSTSPYIVIDDVRGVLLQAEDLVLRSVSLR